MPSQAACQRPLWTTPAQCHSWNLKVVWATNRLACFHYQELIFRFSAHSQELGYTAEELKLSGRWIVCVAIVTPTEGTTAALTGKGHEASRLHCFWWLKPLWCKADREVAGVETLSHLQGIALEDAPQQAMLFQWYQHTGVLLLSTACQECVLLLPDAGFRVPLLTASRLDMYRHSHHMFWQHCCLGAGFSHWKEGQCPRDRGSGSMGGDLCDWELMCDWNGSDFEGI